MAQSRASHKGWAERVELWAPTLASAEVTVTGLFLFASPSLFSKLIFGVEPVFLTEVFGRLAGIAMLSAGVATWSMPEPTRSSARALLFYNALAFLYLGWLGLSGSPEGVLFWPAVGLHALLSAILLRHCAK